MFPLILLHGAIGAKDQLEPLFNLLKNQFEVHSMNFSGHGGEAEQGIFSIEQFAGEVAAYVEEKNLGKVNVFGYSMGGYVALYLAKMKSEQVNRVATLATKFHWDEATAAREVKMLDPLTIEQKVPAFAEQLQRRHAPGDWKKVLEKTKSMLLELGNHNCLQEADYRNINTPSLLLLGEKDKMVTVEETMVVQAAMPHASFQSLPGTPHPLEQVDTGKLAEILTGWFK